MDNDIKKAVTGLVTAMEKTAAAIPGSSLGSEAVMRFSGAKEKMEELFGAMGVFVWKRGEAAFAADSEEAAERALGRDLARAMEEGLGKVPGVPLTASDNGRSVTMGSLVWERLYEPEREAEAVFEKDISLYARNLRKLDACVRGEGGGLPERYVALFPDGAFARIACAPPGYGERAAIAELFGPGGSRLCEGSHTLPFHTKKPVFEGVYVFRRPDDGFGIGRTYVVRIGAKCALREGRSPFGEEGPDLSGLAGMCFLREYETKNLGSVTVRFDAGPAKGLPEGFAEADGPQAVCSFRKQDLKLL